MNEALDRMRDRQGDSLAAFLKNNPEFVAKHYEIGGRKALVISKGAETLPPALLDELLVYQKEHVLFPPGTNVSRRDCHDVASTFQHAFEHDPEFSSFRKANYFSNLLYILSSENGIPFYRALGFGNHVMNGLDYLPEGAPARYAAVDQTAHYNMDLEKGTMDIFVVIADTKEDLLRILSEITGSPWRSLT